MPEKLRQFGRRAAWWLLGVTAAVILLAWWYAGYKVVVVPLWHGLVRVVLADPSFFGPSLLAVLIITVIVGSNAHIWRRG